MPIGNLLLSGLLTAGTLLLVLTTLKNVSRRRAILTLALLYAGLSYWSTLIEAVVFGVAQSDDGIRSATEGTLIAAAVAGVLAALFHSRREQTAVLLPKQGWAWRIPVLALAYAILYLLAGMAIYPWIEGFYANKPLPGLPQLLTLQLLRGALLIVLVIPWLTRFTGSRVKAAVLVPLAYAALGGWAPLLLADRFMPAHIRLAHAIEIGAANCVFGVLVVCMLMRKATHQPMQPPPLQSEPLYRAARSQP